LADCCGDDMAAHYVLAMMFCGWLLGTVFDFYNTVTGSAKWLRWLRPVLDLTFWIAGAVVVFRFSLMTDEGRLRLYTFGLIGIGYLLYAWIAKRFIVGSALAVVQFIRGMVLFIWHGIQILVFQPVLTIIRLVFRCLQVFYQLGLRLENVGSWLIRKLLKIVLFPLTPTLRLLQPWFEKISNYQEGIWTQLSNWLKKSPNGA
jgi:spore cortex biosynthesis protein YabQ